mgnify:CR=1 FL=1
MKTKTESEKEFGRICFLGLLFLLNAQDVPVATGEYAPDWDNLGKWECPEWYQDVKFGIWAHWDPQCQAAGGDWYARGMYFKGSGNYNCM